MITFSPILKPIQKTLLKNNFQEPEFEKIRQQQAEVLGYKLTGKSDVKSKIGNATIKESVKEELINVFVPTTPNPTSGFLLMVPKKDLIYLDVSFEQASKFIVSAGTTNLD